MVLEGNNSRDALPGAGGDNTHVSHQQSTIWTSFGREMVKIGMEVFSRRPFEDPDAVSP